ncbi:LOW QUALITY PROTEIN: TetR-family transcriptional regulator, partial [Kutzneria sp. 744]
MAETRQRLIDGAIETIRQHGIAGTSARTIAATAGVNQALVFYHFGSVNDLLKAACLAAT